MSEYDVYCRDNKMCKVTESGKKGGEEKKEIADRGAEKELDLGTNILGEQAMTAERE